MQSFGPGLLGTAGKNLFVSNFRVYTDFTAHLLGTHHRRQRKLLNPAFSVTHLRNMTPIFHGIARQVLSVSYRTSQWSQPP
jgi:cytochrome P450